jgi:KaiC/GvpD/RAD55 family RecA-like ATPase
MDNELAVLEEKMTPTRSISIVDGGPGSGKKTLAREFARRFVDRFNVVLEVSNTETVD